MPFGFVQTMKDKIHPESDKAFVVYLKKCWILKNISIRRKGSDQTVQMFKLF